MTKVGEHLPVLTETSQDLEQSSFGKLDEQAKTLDFSTQSSGQNQANANATFSPKNPYRCACRPGAKCAIHLASSRLPESRH